MQRFIWLELYFTTKKFIQISKSLNISGKECKGERKWGPQPCFGKCFRLKRDQGTDMERCLTFTENKEGGTNVKKIVD